MNETPEQALERLLSAAVDGSLSDADEQALATLLKADETARRRYLRFMQLHALLEWAHGAEAGQLVTPAGEMVKPSGGTRAAGRWLFAALSLLAASLLVYFALSAFRQPPSLEAGASIARVETVEGSVRFRSGAAERTLTAKQAISAGALMLEGETSAVQVRFADGTLVTLSGPAEASLAEDPQKHVRLRHGLLTAEVQPQPAGAPMIVETPTARIEVLGTVFTLAAEAEQTRVSVDAGRVRVERLVDGKTQEVPAEQSWVASLDRSDNAPLVSQADATSQWHYTFAQPSPKNWKGHWLPPKGSLPGRVSAVPCVVGRDADGKPVVHFGITLRQTADIRLGALPASGVLRLKYRTQAASGLWIFLSVHKANGGFGGNFEAKHSASSDAIDDDGWRVAEIPLADFRSLADRHPALVAGSRPNLILVTTWGDDCGLEVAEASIVATELSE